jgi:2-succinyl-5-enolpyruvyl-6-hydroxy-3-cyclohexene-1-carboxylate synthase
MKYPEIKLAQKIIQYCKSFDIRHIIISPGSRNAPLIMGFYEDPYFKCYSIVDERCAAFFALGMAQQCKHPVILLCTSGSALLNYYPAISEAFYSDIPLLAVSADRPSNKIDIGDGQTIRQKNVFANHSLFNANLFDTTDKFSENDLMIRQAFEVCIKEKGPVHINAPFEEPLYELIQGELPEIPAPDLNVEKPILQDNGQTATFAENWNQYQRKLVLVGVQNPDKIDESVIEILANDPSVVVMTETTSNLHHPEFFPAIDQLIAPIEKSEEEIALLQPDLLITFGGMIISKKIKAFLRKFRPKVHYHIDEKKAYDTFFCLTHHFKMPVNDFFNFLSPDLNPITSDYKSFWSNIKQRRRNRHQTYVSEIPYSDFLVYHHLFSKIPQNTVLQLSNSSTVRYAQLFDIHASLDVFCNRGTSGIDGSTSTAIGAANAVNKPVIFVTGDLSFFYDSNALWNDYIPENFKIILINNGGGGIFRILPGPKTSQKFHKYFETRHQLKANYLCDMFGLSYNSIHNESQLKKQVSKFFSANKGPSLLEIFTPTDLNDEILLNYFKFIC